MRKFFRASFLAVLYFMLFMGIQTLVTLAGSLFLMGNEILQQGMGLFENPQRFHRVYMEMLMKHMTGLVLLSNLLTMAGVFLCLRFRHEKIKERLCLLKTSSKNLSMSCLFGVGICFLMDLVTMVLPFPEPVLENFSFQHSLLWFGDAGLTFLSVAIVGPVSEEIFFRGLCYSRLKKYVHPSAAAILSAAVFGLAHGDPVWFLIGFLAGLSLSWVLEVTGSLYCAIAVHVTNNAISSVMAYVPISESFHRLLIILSIGIALISGYGLYKNNCRDSFCNPD